MKKSVKLICGLLSLAMAAAFAGCSDSTSEVPSAVSSGPVTYFDGNSAVEVDSADVLAKVSSGEMDIEYEKNAAGETGIFTAKLGMSSADFRLTIPEDALQRAENEDFISLSTGMAGVYFTNDDNDNGIVAIVQFADIYGFSVSTTSADAIKSVMGEPVIEGELEEAAAKELLYGAQGATFLSYTSGQNTVRFIFNAGGNLQATVISKNGLWIY